MVIKQRKQYNFPVNSLKCKVSLHNFTFWYSFFNQLTVSAIAGKTQQPL